MTAAEAMTEAQCATFHALVRAAVRVQRELAALDALEAAQADVARMMATDNYPNS
jgi:hypothetical protein